MRKPLAIASLLLVACDATPGFHPLDGGADSGGGGDLAPSGSDGGGAGVGLHVSGTQIVDAAGKPVRLLGVNRSGTEYACVQGNGIFDGPSDDASVKAIAAWHANVVRVPLNEDCWLAINGVAPAFAGANYIQAVTDYVSLLHQNGLMAILELHWTAPGTDRATGQQAMPDRDHAPAFWSDVAGHFKGMSDHVVFEPFNEPFPDGNQDTAAAWTCWRDGGTCPGLAFQAAGMQELVSAIRGAGADNLIMLGGVEYSNSLSEWLTHVPSDPRNNLAAAWHLYNFNTCQDAACFDGQAGPVAAQYPVVATEIGEDDCAGTFITSVMAWLDGHGDSYLGWTWDAWGGCLVLVTDYAGTPAGTYGQTYKAHLLVENP
ncbi:MAG TPA: cellulase family glycosylhydrolase [Polyangia bacterium]|nr:cellulase family glycosylhydrolase [Polyangia bacterium]